jgi:hypothetical protein
MSLRRDGGERGGVGARSASGAFETLRRGLRLPLDLFEYGAVLFGAAMRIPPRAFDQGVEAMFESLSALPWPGSGSGSGIGAASRPPGRPEPAPVNRAQEKRAMRDQDLSGDDVKLVRYKILFVKRDLEVAFPEEEDLVTYPTRPAEYGGLRVADFMRRAWGVLPSEEAAPKIPAKWQSAGYPGESHRSPEGGWRVPPEDERYVKLYFEVLDRFPREAAEYDKQKVEVLRDISRKIG